MVAAAANRRIQDALAQLEREIAAGRPPGDDYDIAIRRDGAWVYRGSPIARMGIVRLFASVLHRTVDGGYWLVTPVERTIVHVEDVPFVGAELAGEGCGRERRLRVRTNLGDWYPIDATHPLTMRPQPTGGEAPYVACRGGLEARLLRPVFYDLVELAEPGADGRLGVWSGERFFALDEAAP